VSSLIAGKSYQYRIKPFHSGPVEIQYLTADGKKTRAIGPRVNKEDAGAIYVALNNGKVEFTGP
jgi:hypothetical protein